jgi:hypothetical protein
VSAHTTAGWFQGQQGWTDATLLDLCLTYIENQNSPEAFKDFLLQAAASDDEPSGPASDGRRACRYCGLPLHQSPEGNWVDATDGDGCSGDFLSSENENESHVPEELP